HRCECDILCSARGGVFLDCLDCFGVGDHCRYLPSAASALEPVVIADIDDDYHRVRRVGFPDWTGVAGRCRGRVDIAGPPIGGSVGSSLGWTILEIWMNAAQEARTTAHIARML